MQANSGTRRRVRHAPGDITVAALLAAGSVAERSRGHRAWLAAGTIVIVNYVAFRAQLRFWQAHLDRTDAFLVSLALESVAIYLAWLAHRAMMADDAALRLRLAAYGTALLIGVLNYSHYMLPGWRPTVAAVTFGAMSAISPWLWSAYSRRENRDELKARGQIEDHAVRLGGNRWFWYPLRSARVQRLAAWAGENRPDRAIALFDARRAGKPAAQAAENVPATRTPPPARPRREPRRAATGLREARAGGQGLAAASTPEQDAARLEARREAGRRGAAIRWNKPAEVPAAQVNGHGDHDR